MIIVDNIKNDGTKISAIIDGVEGKKNFELWFSMPTKIGYFGDPFLAALLPTAMKLGKNLKISEPVSPKLLQQISQIQALWSQWYEWKPVQVIAEAKTKEFKTDGVGCFFSGGVDSFYSLIKQLKTDNPPTHLIFAHGFDIPLDDTERYEQVRPRIEAIADELGVGAVFPTTNIRQLTNGICDWGTVQHGAAIAAVSLGGQFKNIIIPATHTYSDSFSWGSHPLIDPLWSTEYLTITHDGCEATRVQKVIELSKSQIALDNLRVCWHTKNEYNCGKCEKCIRTMVNLVVADSLDQCKTFPGNVSADALASTLKKIDRNTKAFAKENLEGLESKNLRHDLQSVLREVVNKTNFDLSGRIKLLDEALFGGIIKRTLRLVKS